MSPTITTSPLARVAGVDSEGETGASNQKAKIMSRDVIVDEVRRVREQLVKRYGGLDGWIEHLQTMDRQRAGKAKQQTAKKRTANGMKGRVGRRA